MKEELSAQGEGRQRCGERRSRVMTRYGRLHHCASRDSRSSFIGVRRWRAKQAQPHQLIISFAVVPFVCAVHTRGPPSGAMPKNYRKRRADEDEEEEAGGAGEEDALPPDVLRCACMLP